MKGKTLNEKQIAELMMICGALHDLAELVPSKAAHITTIQHKIENIVVAKPLKQAKPAKRA